MKKLLLCLVVAALIVFAGCDNGTGTTGSGPTGVSKTLANLPELEVILPTSLDGGTASKSIKATRAEGDVTAITADSLNPVKSQAWFDMRENVGMDLTTKTILDSLKAYAAVTEIPMDTPIKIPLDAPDGLKYNINYYFTGNTDTDFMVYCYFEAFPQKVYIYIEVKESGGKYEVSLNATIHMDAMEVQGYSQPAMDLAISTYFNQVTGESSMGLDVQGMQQVRKSFPNDDGSYTVIIKDLNEYSNSMSIGWGDDNKGGIVSQWGDHGIDVEYYNGNGYLLKKGWGHTDVYTDWLSYYETENYYNIKDAGLTSTVETIYVRYKSDSEQEYSTDNTNWSSLGSSDYWGCYYKAGSSWAAGDCIYYFDSFDSDKDVWVFTKGYQVPAAQNYFGSSYVMDYQYPLKWLLPLSGTYSGKNLLSVEGETHSFSWTNWEDKEENYSYTWYDYYIDNNDDTKKDDNDILVNGIDFQDVYIWDNTTYDVTKQRAAFFMTSGSLLPSYFGFSPANANLVSEVDTKLNAIYASEEYTNFDMDSFDFYNVYDKYKDIFDKF